MIIYNFQSMDFVAFLCANIVEYRLAILFNSFIVEYLVSILRHQHDVVGNLTIARLKLRNSNAYHILAIGSWNHLWLWCQKTSFYKKTMIDTV